MMHRIAVLIIALGVVALVAKLLEWILDQIDPDSDYLPDGVTLRPDVPRCR
jgi:hypothetical protein